MIISSRLTAGMAGGLRAILPGLFSNAVLESWPELDAGSNNMNACRLSMLDTPPPRMQSEE